MSVVINKDSKVYNKKQTMLDFDPKYHILYYLKEVEHLILLVKGRKHNNVYQVGKLHKQNQEETQEIFW